MVIITINITTITINLKGAAAQLPSPVPAPRSPAWQLAAERRTTACKMIRLDFVEHECVIKRRARACQGKMDQISRKNNCSNSRVFVKYFVKLGQANKKLTISPLCQSYLSLRIKLIKKPMDYVQVSRCAGSPNVSLLGPYRD